MKLVVENRKVPVNPDRSSDTAPKDVVPAARQSGGRRGSGPPSGYRSNASGRDGQTQERVNRYRRGSDKPAPAPEAQKPRENPYSRKRRTQGDLAIESSGTTPVDGAQVPSGVPSVSPVGTHPDHDHAAPKARLWAILAVLWMGGMLAACCMV